MMRHALVLMAILAPSAGFAQGARPLDDAAYAAALSEGKQVKAWPRETNYPMLARLTSGPRIDGALLAQVEAAPFAFYIQTPYSNVAGRIAFLMQKFSDGPQLSMAEANASLVEIHVSPGETFPRADAIELVVLKRGDVIVKPVKTVVEPSTVQNGFGVKRDLSSGTFTFSFEPFESSLGPLTIVMVGKGGNFEWTMTSDELKALR